MGATSSGGRMCSVESHEDHSLEPIVAALLVPWGCEEFAAPRLRRDLYPRRLQSRLSSGLLKTATNTGTAQGPSFLRTHALKENLIRNPKAKRPKDGVRVQRRLDICATRSAPSRVNNARQARAAGLPLALSRMPAMMLLGTGSKRNGSIE
jgi:hypothetical protein